MAKGWDKDSLRHSAARKFGKAPPYRKKAGLSTIKKKTPASEVNPNRLIGLTTKEAQKKYGWTYDELSEFMDNNELNVCDKCDTIDRTHDLVWITAEDFEPKAGEIVSKELYKKYDALCEDCYSKSVKKKSPFDKNIYYAGKKMKLYKVYDEKKQPNWSTRAQANIDAEKRAGNKATVVHKGNLHGYYLEEV